MKIKNRTKRKGSALLVAILVMAILMTVTLGLSSLIVSEIRQTGDMVAAGKAYYAAEAGVENALLDLHEHLPGYQTKDTENDNWEVYDEEDGGLSYRYKIGNQGDSYPYFDPEKPVFLQAGVGTTIDMVKKMNPEATYNILPLHQTVTIPLFVDCGNGKYKDVKSFLLQYYVDFEMPPRFADQLEKFDIMRWKLFGQPAGLSADQPGKTDAISDFYPAGNQDSAKNPVCIGSDPNMLGKAEFVCTPLAVDTYGDLPEYINDWRNLDVNVGAIFSDAFGAARECYTSDAGGNIGNEVSSGIQRNCNIGSFVETHTKNYLTITNVVNPQIIDLQNPAEQAAKANIYYRIVAEKNSSGDAVDCPASGSGDSDVMVREYAEISADGYAANGTVKQSIDAKLRLNSFLPVFNFSLFRTNPDKQDPDVVSEGSFPLGGI